MNAARVELSDANAFVAEVHRHHAPVVGHRFSLGAEKDGALVGVAICGRPVAKGIDKRGVLEVTRLATNGARNACSWLYSAAARTAGTMGFRAVITYTLASEAGASLRACGWWDELLAERDTDWDCASRGRGRQSEMFGESHARGTKLGQKRRWLWLTGCA